MRLVNGGRHRAGGGRQRFGARDGRHEAKQKAYRGVQGVAMQRLEDLRRGTGYDIGKCRAPNRLARTPFHDQRDRFQQRVFDRVAVPQREAVQAVEDASKQRGAGGQVGCGSGG